MADELRMALLDLLVKAELEQDTDFLREGVRALSEALLEPRRRAERALVAVVQEAYVQGVATRRIDKVIQALELEGISASQVSRVCKARDDAVARFRTRLLTAEYPYVWLDATFVKAHEQGRVVLQAIVIAVGVRLAGKREVIGLDVGPSEDGEFWLQFLRGLVGRGLRGVQLIVSDAHLGLQGAIATALAGATWQRCRCTFCATRWRWCPRPPSRWPRRPSGPSWPSRTLRVAASR